MRPLQCVLGEDNDLKSALACFHQNALNDPVLQIGDWKLVSTQIVPTAKAATGILSSNNPGGMQLVVTVVGIFEQQQDTAVIMSEGIKGMLGEQGVKQFQRRLQHEACEHEWGEGGKCIHCGTPL